MSELKPPPPLEWHPAYSGQTWLLDWLNGVPGYPEHTVLVQLPQPHRAILDPYPSPWDHRDRRITLDKRKAAGPAPYVGEPFCYGWWFATDHLGRGIASDSFRVYRDGRIER